MIRFSKILFVFLSATACLCLPSIGDDLNPAGFRGLPASVFSEFDFNDGGSNPSPPTNFNWVPGPAGEPLHPLNPGILFNPNFFNFDNGTWFNISPKPSSFRIQLPNIIDDFEIKLMHVQITWLFDGKSPAPNIFDVAGEDAEDGSLSVVIFQEGQTMTMGNMRHTSYNIFVRPNPDWETIDVLVRPGMGIKQVVVGHDQHSRIPAWRRQWRW